MKKIIANYLVKLLHHADPSRPLLIMLAIMQF
jgi:hypothetical protein